MSGKTAIEWSDTVWNPVTGCTRVSAGCDHCYAFDWHDRIYIAWKRGDRPSAPVQYQVPFSQVQLLEKRLRDPLRWTRPRKVFVNSMGDLFHDDVPIRYIAQVFAVMAVAERHRFQLLTKRPLRMQLVCRDLEFVELVASYASRFDEQERSGAVRSLPTFPWPLPNVWLGVSVEDQAAAEMRIPPLLETPAAIRFLSIEPLLGPVDLDPFLRVTECSRCGSLIHKAVSTPETWCADCCVDEINAFAVSDGAAAITHHGMFPSRPALHWIIVGGESGPHARPMHPAWARDLRDQTVAAGVSLFFKQWGEWGPVAEPTPVKIAGDTVLGMARVGKKAAGRRLDGRTWDQFPEVAHVRAHA